MGENKHIDELDIFAKKVFNNIAEKSPSVNFTEDVMKQINAIENSKIVNASSYNYRYSIYGIVISFVIASVFLIFQENKSEASFFNFNISDITFVKLPQLTWLQSLNLSVTTMYALFFFTILFIVQTIVLKQYFNRRI